MPHNIAIKLFFIFTFLWSWVFWIPVIPQIQSIFNLDLNVKIGWLGFMGPGLSAVLCSFLQNGGNGIKKLFSPLFRWRIRAKYYFLIYIGAFVFFALGAYLTISFEVIHQRSNHGQTLHGVAIVGVTEVGAWVKIALSRWWLWCFSVVLMTIIATLCEEMGWRGYALPMLTKKMNIFLASIVLGVLWAVWQSPLVVWLCHDLNSFIHYFVYITLHCVSFSLILSWIYFKGRQSYLVTGLLYGYTNALIYLFPEIISPSGYGLNGVMLAMEIAMAILTIPFLLKIHYVKLGSE